MNLEFYRNHHRSHYNQTLRSGFSQKLPETSTTVPPTKSHAPALPELAYSHVQPIWPLSLPDTLQTILQHFKRTPTQDAEQECQTKKIKYIYQFIELMKHLDRYMN
jgi:hypothetical protein